MQEIVKRIQSGELCRHNDEAYRDGFWDLAGQLCNCQCDGREMCRQDEIYNALWGLYEATTGYRDKCRLGLEE